MMPSLKSWSFKFGTLGILWLVAAYISLHFGWGYAAVVFALAAGTQLKFTKEYHVENTRIQILAAMVCSGGPRDKYFRETAMLTVSRLEQVARKSQLLPNETLSDLLNQTQLFCFKLEDTIKKEGL
jgi:hypothetical protein